MNENENENDNGVSSEVRVSALISRTKYLAFKHSIGLRGLTIKTWMEEAMDKELAENKVAQ